MTPEPKFGDRVMVTQKYRRRYDFTVAGEPTPGAYGRVWRRQAIEPRSGLLIGYRTLMDVRVVIDDSAIHRQRVRFETLKRIRAGLVVFNGSQNPVYVPVDAMAVAS